MVVALALLLVSVLLLVLLLLDVALTTLVRKAELDTPVVPVTVELCNEIVVDVH
jgi:hypothetical protein